MRAIYVLSILFVASITSTVGIQSAGAMPTVDLPGIVSVTIWEDTRVLLTDPLNEVTIPLSDNRLSTRLTTLDASNHDFAVFRSGFDEFYDFFFSNADGRPNPRGAFLTVEVRYNPASSSNGGNISAVALNFLDGRRVFANFVASFVVLGPGDAKTVVYAVDGDLDTATLLGNTLGSDQRLRLTVGFPPIVVEVRIDIRPRNCPNSINPKSEGRIPVAILTTDSFNAATVHPTSVRFGATGTEATPVHTAMDDVDEDGDTDMILHFNTQDTGIVCGDTDASLTGETVSGQKIGGYDSIKTVGCMKGLG